MESCHTLLLLLFCHLPKALVFAAALCPGHLWRDKWTALSGPLSIGRNRAAFPPRSRLPTISSKVVRGGDRIHPENARKSGCAWCGAGAGCSAIKYHSLSIKVVSCATRVRTRAAGPVHLIITMIKWIRTSRLSIRNSLLCPAPRGCGDVQRSERVDVLTRLK